MEAPFLSVVIPAYNEEENIKNGALQKVADYLLKQKYQWEVIVVNDGSDDQTAFLVSEFAKSNDNYRLIKNPHQGKAATVITGVMNSHGKYVLFSDMDQATPISEVEKFIPYLEENFDLVIGSRRARREGAPLLRKAMGVVFNFIVQLIALPGIPDSQCGFKSFKGEVIKNIFSKMRLYKSTGKEIHGPAVTAGFDVELLFLARKFGYKIKEVDVGWHHVGTGRVNPLKDSLRALRDVIKVRINDLFGAYR